MGRVSCDMYSFGFGFTGQKPFVPYGACELRQPPKNDLKTHLLCGFQKPFRAFCANLLFATLLVIIFAINFPIFRLFTGGRTISAVIANSLYTIYKFLSTLFQTMIYFLKHSNSNTAFLMVLPSSVTVSVTFLVLAAAATGIFLFMSIVTISVANTLSP